MKKITVLIKDNSLLFKYRTNKPVGPNLLNTNVISNNELVFSDEYMIENCKIVGLFLSDLVKERNITDVIVTDVVLAEMILDLIKSISTIKKLIITADDNMTYSLCEKLISNKYIKTVNCYSIPQFMIELLDKKGIKVESRYEVLFTSNFTADNQLTSFSKMYYKSNVKINDILTQEDLNDFRTFCQVNKYLKVIHFDKASLENINLIINILKELKEKNINIQIHEDIIDSKLVVKLRELNKELKKKYKIKISLSYSEDYIKTNYIQQITFTTLKICALLIFGIVTSVSGYVLYNNYSSEKEINKITEDIVKAIEDDQELQKNADSGQDTNNEPVVINTKYLKWHGKDVINSYNKLLEINEESVGWLTINNTNINYPVVKAKNNKYYLTHNIYKNYDYNGWVFMDYRNSIDNLSDNTIIYAHNRYTSGVMFGTLPKIEKSGWYKNKNNHYITFNSLFEEMTWRVFSFYSIDVTSDYLFVNFKNDTKAKEEFFDMLTKRSEYDFGVKPTANDKIITFSTCLENDRRFVVHAVLVK